MREMRCAGVAGPAGGSPRPSAIVVRAFMLSRAEIRVYARGGG
jgi:ribosomal protein S14